MVKLLEHLNPIDTVKRNSVNPVIRKAAFVVIKLNQQTNLGATQLVEPY